MLIVNCISNAILYGLFAYFILILIKHLVFYIKLLIFVNNCQFVAFSRDMH